MDKEPFNVLNFDHGKYEFYEGPNRSTDMIYRPIGTDISKNPDETIIQQFGIPTISDLDIERSIDNVLSSEELIKQMNDFVLEDEKERYVRALLNRISKAITVLEEGIEFCKNDSQGVYDKCNMAIKREEKVIAILKGDTNE